MPPQSPPARPRVLLTMPRYGGTVHMGAAMGLLAYPSRGDVDIVAVGGSTCSLLGETFNQLLAQGLTARDRGEITHFAMLHADIEPPPFWLDTLWHEMQASGADLISAVVPMKMPTANPLTSTAVAPENRPWMKPDNLDMDRVDALPVTFGPAEVCGPGEVLLVNTGCWLTDLRHPAWDSFQGFQVLSRIVSLGRGQYRTEVRPEDWEMSRHMHFAGMQVRATRALNLKHHGEFGWASVRAQPEPPRGPALMPTPEQLEELIAAHVEKHTLPLVG